MITLERCKRSNALYQQIRDRHYIENHGAVGQQIHYLIIKDGKGIGIISGGSAAYAVKSRDEYFGISKDNRQVALNSVIDNTVFRLELNEKNLATQILSIWRKQIVRDWEEKYMTPVVGFETFVIETETRKGTIYKADNWDFVGYTQGSTKFHLHGIDKQFQRVNVERKMIFCKKIKGKQFPDHYYANWKTNGCRGQMQLSDFMDCG